MHDVGETYAFKEEGVEEGALRRAEGEKRGKEGERGKGRRGGKKERRVKRSTMREREFKFCLRLIFQTREF